MSKKFDFTQTSIPSQFSINLLDKYQLNWLDARTSDIFRTLFTTIADVLKMRRDKNKSRIGFVMKDDKGNFRLGAILNYRKPDEGEEEDSGNWYLEFTFYPEDMTDLDEEYDNHSDEFIVSAQEEAYVIASARFNSTKFMYMIFNTVIDTLVDFLDVNAIEGEEVEVTMRGVFTASVVVENGVKVMSIVPGEVIKQVVKADAIL